MAAPKKVDWTLIEADWRAGIKPLTQIVEEYKEQTGTTISRASIGNHFNKLKIDRDLEPAIRQKAAVKVTKSMVTGKESVTNKKDDVTLSDNQIVDKSSTLLADLQLRHRKDVGHNKSIVLKLLSELDFQTDNQDLYEQLLDLVDQDLNYVKDGEKESKAQQDRRYKRRVAFEKALSTGGRIDSVKKLAEALRILIDMERKIHGIDSGTVTEDSHETWLKKVREYETNKNGG